MCGFDFLMVLLFSLLLQPGFVFSVSGRCPRSVSGHRKHSDSLPRPPVFAHLPPKKERGTPEICDWPFGSELFR